MGRSIRSSTWRPRRRAASFIGTTRSANSPPRLHHPLAPDLLDQRIHIGNARPLVLSIHFASHTFMKVMLSYADGEGL